MASSLVSKIRVFKDIIFGPRLFQIFEQNIQTGRRQLEKNYELTTFEWLGESFIHTVSYAMSFAYYCSPVVLYYIYSRGILTDPDKTMYYIKFCAVVCLGLSFSYLIRGVGRMRNPQYIKFHSTLRNAIKDRNHRDALQLYDFEFSSWPVDFTWKESTIKSSVGYLFDDVNDSHSEESSILTSILSIPSNFLQYTLGHLLARPMAFPGSVKLLQAAMGPALTQGRTGLIEKNGLRSKLLTKDGNEIDTMFIDRRDDRPGANGNTLVISCEGNAAFYEVGCMGTPMKGGYSVLGWNHPGFMGSTGLPFPEAERNAMDVVIQYAVTRLGFPVNNTIMFAWSIGGYTASYAAMAYPNMKALILDATFDDIIQLAVTRMPEFASGIVRNVIHKYMLLNNTRHVLKYPGPILLIRRQREEIITTTPGDPATNRGNFLLIKLLLFRYPNIISKEALSTLIKFLSARNGHYQGRMIENLGGFDEDECEMKLAVESTKMDFPLDIGHDFSEEERIKLTLYLATKYMLHYDATHCMPLPQHPYFRFPWQHKVL